MSKAIIEKVVEQYSLSKKTGKELVEFVFDELAKEILTGEKVRISGFGTFSTKERAARKGRNPATGEEVQIAAKTVVKFTPAKELKESANA